MCPLAERLSFVSIYQSNLDDFLWCASVSLMDQMHAGEKIRDNKTNMTSKQQVEAILERTRELEALKTKIYEQLWASWSRRTCILSTLIVCLRKK